jgi:hypothetical protein
MESCSCIILTSEYLLPFLLFVYSNLIESSRELFLSFFSKLANTISVGWTDAWALESCLVLILIRPKIDEQENEHNPGTVNWHIRFFFSLFLKLFFSLSTCWTGKKEQIIFLLFVFFLPSLLDKKEKYNRSRINIIPYIFIFSLTEKK